MAANVQQRILMTATKGICQKCLVVKEPHHECAWYTDKYL